MDVDESYADVAPLFSCHLLLLGLRLGGRSELLEAPIMFTRRAVVDPDRPTLGEQCNQMNCGPI